MKQFAVRFTLLLTLCTTFLSISTLAESKTVHASSLNIATSSTHSGMWKIYSPRGANPKAIPPPPGGNCPSNALNYSGNLAQYNCYEISYDGASHGVWTRQGTPNTFGLQHFLPHNLEFHVVDDVISGSSQGSRQPNGRYFYGAYHANPDGGLDQFVQIFEERGRPNDTRVNDGNELGVVTAFCEDEYGNQEQLCPDWVNQTL